MKLSIFRKVVSLSLFLITLGSLTLSTASSLDSKIVQSSGSVIYWPRVDVTINPSQVVGKNNLSLGFMVDWEWKVWRDSSVLRDLAGNASFTLVRLFDFRKTGDILAPCTYWNETAGSGTWNWANVDSLVQKIYAVGAEPLWCLGGVTGPAGMATRIPSGMATNPTTGLPYPDSWAAYCREWAKHFKGTPVRFFEIVNEPWMYFGWIDYAKLANFMTLVNAAAQAMRAENPNVLIGFDGTNRKPVLDYWLANGGTDLGFISFHKYDEGIIGQYDDVTMLSRAETFQLQTSYDYYGIQDARKAYYNARGKWIPVINSESNYNSACDNGTDPRIQQMVGSVWLALALKTGISNGLDYSIYFEFANSASWDLLNKPSGGLGFGMVNYDDNKPWYPYYVQKMIATNLKVGDVLYNSSSSSSDVRSLSWINGAKLETLLICRTNQTLAIYLHGATGNLNLTRIDNTIPWDNPARAVQTQTIAATEPIVMYGYTVALLSS